MTLYSLRQAYHQRICHHILRIIRKDNKTYPNFADGSNRSSVQIAWNIFNQLKCPTNEITLPGQTAGGRFETITKDFLEESFLLLQHLRPGKWFYLTETLISQFDQYEHLAYVETAVKQDANLASALGGDYIIKPDIVVGRYAISDAEINTHQMVINQDSNLAKLTPLREANSAVSCLILHASISCKWTIRSDRSQNARTEALNLIRNRKGNLPHIVVVTAEPLPTRLATLALGTGDLDCVYHFALPELQSSIEEADNQDQLELLHLMINGRRLRDISDLPFDLTI